MHSEHYAPQHWQRVREEIDRAFSETPFYAALGAEHPVPVSSDPQVLESWTAALPPLSKRDVRRGFPRGWTPRGLDLNSAMVREEVVLLGTSGTTEDRVQVLWDAGWWDRQERDGMRTNAQVARTLARPGYREAVLTTPVCAGQVCHIGDLSMAERTLMEGDAGILFMNQVADPTFWREADLVRMAAELDAFAPAGLEADPAYLAALARWEILQGRTPHRDSLAFVQLSYEFTTSVHQSRIRQAFDVPVLQLYGSTESGVLFMECEAGRLHANAAHTHVDLVPVGDSADGAGRLVRVVSTTLGRRWMPLVRFDQGDLLRIDAEPSPCPCGLATGPIARSVEGRIGDLTWTVSRRPVTTGAIDRALAPFSGAGALDGWQVTQEGPSDVRLRWVPAPGAPASLGLDAAEALARLYGDGDAKAVRVRAEKAAAIFPEASGKYRASWAQVELAAGTRLSRERHWERNPLEAA